MFCPNCKAILDRVRTAYGIQEFCNCPGKKRSEFYGELHSRTSTKNRRESRSSSTVNSDHKRNRKLGRSTESINIPETITPSEYTKLALNVRIATTRTKLPFNWDKGKVGELLNNRLNNAYERFYRKFENYFIVKNTELRFFVLLEPTPQMTEFNVVKWGIGALEKELKSEWKLIKWYQGTKLLLDWGAKIREKEGDFITPANYFKRELKPEYSQMNYLPQKDWFDKLAIFWENYKKISPDLSFKAPNIHEIYQKWRKML